jgi:hypothetical protein
VTSKASSGLAGWSAEAIDAECAAAYRVYHEGVRQRHLEYFRLNPGLRHSKTAFAADTFEAALPRGWERLAPLIPAATRHRHHLSGGSSQTLALGLLGPAAMYGKSLQWLFEPHGPFRPVGERVAWQFEYSVGFGLLNEPGKSGIADAAEVFEDLCVQLGRLALTISKAEVWRRGAMGPEEVTSAEAGIFKLAAHDGHRLLRFRAAGRPRRRGEVHGEGVRRLLVQGARRRAL